MIKVENLTKRYAGQTAIQDLNFEVGKGEIMGFLGPNGAGQKHDDADSLELHAADFRARVDRRVRHFRAIARRPGRISVTCRKTSRSITTCGSRSISITARRLKGVPHRRVAERVGDVKELCGLERGREENSSARFPKVIGNASVWRTRSCTNPIC